MPIKQNTFANHIPNLITPQAEFQLASQIKGEIRWCPQDNPAMAQGQLAVRPGTETNINPGALCPSMAISPNGNNYEHFPRWNQGALNFRRGCRVPKQRDRPAAQGELFTDYQRSGGPAIP